MITIEIDAKKYLIPRSWSECNQRQVQHIARFAMGPQTPEAAGKSLFWLLPRQAANLLRQVNAGQFYATARAATSWIWESPRWEEEEAEVHPVLASFRIGATRYFLPRHTLLDMTIEEWGYVDLYMQELADIEAGKEEKEEAVLSLVATVCRPGATRAERNHPDFDGAVRTRFNAERIEEQLTMLKRSVQWRSHKDAVCFAVQHYLLRCIQMLRSRYEPVFGGSARGGADFGYQGLMMSVADAGALGTLQQVKKVNIHEVLLFAMQRELNRQTVSQG